MPIDPEVRYTRTKDFESKVAGLEFPPDVWTTLSLLERPSSAREIAAALLAPVSVATDALERLLEAGLIQTKAIGWNEFAQRAKSPVPAAVRAESDATVAIRLTPAVPAVPATVTLRISAPAKPAPAAPTGWKLRPALEAISTAGGGGVQGQLLVYKVFLQLPPELLKAAGIESVNAIPPDFVLTDARLRDNLIEAARTHASVDVAPLLSA